VLVLVFIVLVGNSPSIMRAALVSFISIITWYYGRNIRPVLLILLVAAITAGINPIYLWSDIGWYLSFLAFFGVLVLAPLIIRRISHRKQPKLITLVLVETIAAQVMTMPIIIYIFGRASLVSIPANLLVVPFVPLAMLLALIAGVCGMIASTASGVIAVPARLILTYMLDVANLFSRIPHVVMERSMGLVQMLYMYCLLGGVVVILGLKNGDKHGRLTDKKVSL
jgi:competence protein ComEC